MAAETGELQAELAQLNELIDEKTEDLFSQIEKREREFMTPESVQEEGSELDSPNSTLIELLEALQAETDQIEQMLDTSLIDDVGPLIESLASHQELLNEWYPNSLLSVDISRKLQISREMQSRLAAQEWNSALEFDEYSFTINQSVISSKALEYGRAALLSKLERVVINPMLALDLSLDLNQNKKKLIWSNIKEGPGAKSVPALRRNVQVFIEFVSHFPQPLDQIVPQRFGSHLTSQLLRMSIPQLYPDTADPSEFEALLRDQLIPLETDYMRTHGWTKSNEIARFVEIFPSSWTDVRQETYLVQLRRLFDQPMTEDLREQTVEWSEEDNQGAPSVEKQDEWEWNEDDDEAEVESTNGSAHNDNNDKLSSPYRLVALWNNYINEVSSPVLFLDMFRALVPVCYGTHDLWIYEDTQKFLSHVRLSSKVNENDMKSLVDFSNDRLDIFVRNQLDKLESTLLPGLTSSSQNKEAVKSTLSLVDSLAMSTNAIGGSVLRQSVLSVVVERIVVYVIENVESLHDIGDIESQQLATVILKLDPLAVYFDQVAETVPSWLKLEMLRNLLTGNLQSIEDMLEEHKLLDFSVDELAGLVKALFRDSPQRKELIRKIHVSIT